MKHRPATDDHPCSLCGLPIGDDRWLLASGDALLHFCCPGCRQAYVISRRIEDARYPEPGGELLGEGREP